VFNDSKNFASALKPLPGIVSKSLVTYTYTRQIQKMFWAIKQGTTPSVKSFLSNVDGKKLEELLPKNKINTLPVRKVVTASNVNPLEIKDDPESEEEQ
jgi:hypothetical protein